MKSIITYNQFLNESKRVGIVYHFCSFSSAYNILKTNILNSSHNYQLGFKTVSTTRDKFFINTREREKITIGGHDIGFVLDGDMLSIKYKVQPFDDRWERTDKKFTRSIIGDEQEEAWYGKLINRDGGIENIRNYIKKIIFTKFFISRVERNQVQNFFDVHGHYLDFKRIFSWNETTTPEDRLIDFKDFFEKTFNIKVEMERKKEVNYAFETATYEYVNPADVTNSQKAVDSILSKRRNVAMVDVTQDEIQKLESEYPFVKFKRVLEEGTPEYKNYVEELKGWKKAFGISPEYLANTYYIMYIDSPKGKSQAEELHQILKRNNGFTSNKDLHGIEQSLWDEYRVGQLLEYDPDSIRNYLYRNYPKHQVDRIF